MNLQKVVNDLHGANEQTKIVALTLLLKLPGGQLVSNPEVFRQLGFLANDGAAKSQGKLGELFVEFRDRLETLRAQHESQVVGDAPRVDLKGLGRGDPAVQVATLRQIQEEGVEKAAGEVRALLEVGSVDRVVAATLKTLAAIGQGGQDLDRVRTFLGHPAGLVRAAAVQAFAAFADPDGIVMTLGPALGDRHPQVRMNAIRALASVGRAAIEERLLKLTTSASPEERAKALPLLSYLRGDRVVEMVRKMAADSSDSLRLDVVNILRAHGGKQVISTLEWLAQDQHPVVRTHAARSILLLRAGRGQRPGLDISQLDTVPSEPPSFDVPDLAGVGPDQVIPMLMRIKRQTPPGAYERVAPMLELEDLKVEVIASVLSTLAVLGGREDIPRVRPFLAHMDGRVRANAVEAVDMMGGRKEILTWLTPLLADPIQRVKKNVLTALGRFGEAVFLGHLQRMLHSNHMQVRISGAYALAHYPGAAAKKLAQVVLKDKESEVRLNFAEALAGKSEPWTKEVLGELAKSDMDFRVREAASISLETPAKANAPDAQRVGASPIEVGAGAGGVPAPQAAPPAPLAPPPAAPSMPSPAGPPPGGPVAVAGAGAGIGAPPPPPPGVVGSQGPGPAADEEPVYTMVDGLPMCEMPSEPSPSVRVSNTVKERDGLSGEQDLEAKVPAAFRPSVDVPRELILSAAMGASQELDPPSPPVADAAAAAAAPEAPAEASADDIPDADSAVEEGEALVLESMTANAQDGGEAGESSTDMLGRTFMNFAALLNPGKMASLKEVQKLEKERSAVLEKFGRSLYEQIENGTIRNSAFERTLYVLKKYLHSRAKGGAQKKPEEGKGWLGKLFGGGGEEEGAGSDEPPRLRAQYRNLAKEALKLHKQGELNLDAFHNHVRDVGGIDAKIAELQK